MEESCASLTPLERLVTKIAVPVDHKMTIIF